jgi:hypothetical protein
MKYLITGRRNVVPMPLEEAARLFQAAKLWINAALAEGRMDCAFAFADTKSVMAITNADSHEDACDGLVDYPLYMFLDWEVQALCDPSHVLDKLTQVVQQAIGE